MYITCLFVFKSKNKYDNPTLSKSTQKAFCCFKNDRTSVWKQILAPLKIQESTVLTSFRFFQYYFDKMKGNILICIELICNSSYHRKQIGFRINFIDSLKEKLMN